MSYSHQCLDLGSPSSPLQWCLRSQLVALPICRDKIVTPSGQGTQYIVLPDFGPQTMSCAGLWACSATPPSQAREFVALITTVASSSTWSGNLPRAPGKPCSPSYNPTYNGIWAERSASSSYHLQSPAGGFNWPENLVYSYASFGSLVSELCQPWNLFCCTSQTRKWAHDPTYCCV